MKAYKKLAYQKGFTLIELLIVIVIIVVLAAAAFVALDPATRFQDSRDATRYQDVTAVVDALKVQQIDDTTLTDAGTYITAVENMNNGSYYMIGTEADSATCAAAACTDEPLAIPDCVDLTGAVTEGYIASIPIAPTAAGGSARDATLTGYWITKSSVGTLSVGACDSENTTTISVGR